jgi:hypothetical protein
MARSSPSTDPGIERHSRNKAITPARVKIRAERCSGQPAWLKAPMAHYTSSMTFSRPDLARRLQRRWIRQSRLGAGGDANEPSAAFPPEGVHPDAGSASRQLSVPPGAITEQVALRHLQRLPRI